MRNKIERARERIKRVGLIPILRGDFSAKEILTIGEALLSSGIPVVEVTLNSQNAFDGIAALCHEFGSDMLTGAGTVRTRQQVESALAVGAQFIVSPNLDLEAVAYSQRNGTLPIPGIFTASEAHNAFAAGCRMVKLFPADVLGPAYLRALRAPLNDIEFIPTGGITLDNIAEYVEAGAVAVGVGSSLVKKSMTREEIVSRACAFRVAWEKGKHA